MKRASRLLFTLIGLLVIGSAVLAAPPQSNIVLPPRPGNPRNSEGT